MIIDGYTPDDYLQLQDYLCSYFMKDYYEDEEGLRQDFQQFKEDGTYDYVMTRYGCPDINIKPEHWNICKACHQPFLTMDRRSISTTCYRYPYKRFSFKKREFFNGSYECYNRNRVDIVTRSQNKVN